jgi:hypothetical protein
MTMDTGGDNLIANAIRIAILGDNKQFKSVVGDSVESAKAAADGIKGAFADVGGFLSKAVGFFGVAAMVDKSAEAASKLTGQQNLQATILKNQLSPELVKQFGITKGIEGNYSKILANAAMIQSTSTGMSVTQITQAQTMFLTNKELANMFATGQKITSGPLTGMNVQLENAMNAAANLAGTMGGNVYAASRLLNRVLEDPAKRVTALRRSSLQLSTDQINSIKEIEASQGKVAARYATLQLVNSELGGAAQAVANPMEKLQNDFQNLTIELGEVFLPLINAFSDVIANLVGSIAPMMQQLANVIKPTMMAIGTAIGDVFTIVEPILNTITTRILPDLMMVLQPIIDAFGKMANAFANSAALKDFLTIIGKLFDKLSLKLLKLLLPLFTNLQKTFDKMSKNGQLDKLFKNLANVFATLLPILPQLIQFAITLVETLFPLFLQFFPILIQFMQWGADFLSWCIKAVGSIGSIAEKFLKWADGLPIIKQLSHHTGVLKDIILGLVAVWFTRGMFLAPLKLIIGTIDKMRDSIKLAHKGFTDLKAGGFGKGLRQILGLGGAAEKDAQVVALDANTAALGENTAALGSNAVSNDVSDAENLLGGGKGKDVEEAGGFLKKFIKFAKNPIEGFKGMAGGALGKLKNLFGRGGAKAAGNALEGGGEAAAGDAAATGEAAASTGEAALATGGAEAAAATGGEALAGAGVAAAGTGAAEGGILAAGLASAPETLGVGLAVAAVAAGVVAFHKQIGHAISKTAKFLYHGAQDVAKWGSKEFGHVENGVKNVAKFVGHVGHAAMGLVTGGLHAAGTIAHGIGSAIGGFFGGLFGGGGGSSSSSSTTTGNSDKMIGWLIRIAHNTSATAILLDKGGKPQEIARMMKHPAMKKMVAAHSDEMMRQAIAKMFGGSLGGSLVGSLFGNGSPASAAKAIAGAGRTSGPTHHVTISPNAFVVNVTGGADPKVAKQIEAAIQKHFKEMLRTTSAMRA